MLSAYKSTRFGELEIPFDACNRPDCLNCMRTKLRATCVVVFVKADGIWELGSFQADIPQDAAEAIFYGMLRNKVPQTIADLPSGILLSNSPEISQAFPHLGILADKSIVAARVMLGEFQGVRLAWRDQNDAFSPEELLAIRCSGSCPEGCGVRAS